MLRSISNEILMQKRYLTTLRSLSTKKPSKPSKASSSNKVSTSSTASRINPNVAGLSNKCVEVPNAPVGPGAAKDKEYKNPEYFCYNIDSFGEAEVELAKYRLPAPSNKVPFKK